MKIALAAIIALSACTPAVGGARESQPGWSEQRTCFKTEYREEYVPGTEANPGYVKSYKDTIEVPCERMPEYKHEKFNPEYQEDPNPHVGHQHSTRPSYRRHVTVYEDVDTNDCSDGTIAGALLGGGLAGFGSRGKDRWWAIPSGAIVGGIIGCDIDGG